MNPKIKCEAENEDECGKEDEKKTALLICFLLVLKRLLDVRISLLHVHRRVLNVRLRVEKYALNCR